MMSGMIRQLCVLAFLQAGAYAVNAEPVGFQTSYQYTMGPQDKLKVRVYDWRVGTYDTHEWPALTGEFSVGASGSVSFPIVGEIPAEGKTPAELAALISERLRISVGLAQTPFASVEVIQYRPFYILGDVAKPGDYHYRPGLTVLQALGVGGGLERASDSNVVGLERDVLSGRGEIRVLEAERRHVLIRQARIAAELDGKSSVQWPADIIDQAGDPTMDRAMREETNLLESHRRMVGAQSGSLAQTRALLAQELASLKAKHAILLRQEELSQSELTLVSKLVARGLAGTPRQVAIQQNQAQLESSRVDLELTTLRTQQDGVRISREQVDFEAKNRSQLLVEEADLRARLSSLTERIASLKHLVDRTTSRLPMLASKADRRRMIVTYSVARSLEGEIVYQEVAENFFLRPGDTLRVEVHHEENGAVASSSQ